LENVLEIGDEAEQVHRIRIIQDIDKPIGSELRLQYSIVI
jgi:hypothetical protein